MKSPFRAVLVAVGVVVLVAAVVLLATRGGDPPEAAAASDDHDDLPAGVVELAPEAQRTAGIETGPVATAPLPAVLSVTGAVAPVETRVAHVRPLARGVVERVSVTLGQRVARGDALVTFDNIELGERIGEFLAQAAALRQAEADLTVRQRVFERAQALIEIEAVSEQELELRRAEFQNAQAAVASQRAQLAQVEEQLHRFGLSEDDVRGLEAAAPGSGGAGDAAAASGHRTASHNVLRAPFDGVITSYDIAPGELVDPQKELLTVTDLSEVWVLADVYEQDLARVETGRDVEIVVDAYPDRTFDGRLTYVSDVIDPATRTAKVRCVVGNPDRLLKLDMFARIRIPTGDSRQVMGVPETAVQRIDGQTVVFVRRSPTRFERRDVEIGATAGDLVEITGGLEPGEVIATTGTLSLKTTLLGERIGGEH
ncbi:MAG: efflux RND transporter periplasmic adaptor subunit [Vicinamibacterales bacterium]